METPEHTKLQQLKLLLEGLSEDDKHELAVKVGLCDYESLVRRIQTQIHSKFPYYSNIKLDISSHTDMSQDYILFQFRGCDQPDYFDGFTLELCVNHKSEKTERKLSADDLDEEIYFNSGIIGWLFLSDIWPILQKSFPTLSQCEIRDNGGFFEYRFEMTHWNSFYEIL